MENEEIIQLVKECLASLLKDEAHLIQNDLSEQSISHKLAEKLQAKFPAFHVDCEYNGDVTKDDGRKRISLLKVELSVLELLREEEASDLEKEFTDRAVFPDIIIHRRSKIEFNTCIIEMKKSTSKVTTDYDYLKLRSFTGYDYHNDLHYQLGILILINTGIGAEGYTLKFFRNGEQDLHLG